MKEKKFHITKRPMTQFQLQFCELIYNLWWTWNPQAQRLLASLDSRAWEAVGHNPIDLFFKAEEQWEQSSKQTEFLAALKLQRAELAEYFKARSWFERTAAPKRKNLQIAYFCAEYGLHESLPLYAGGLGILAGDHLKSAADLGLPLVGVGLLYHYGYYRQQLNRDGSTHTSYSRFPPLYAPLFDREKLISIPMGRKIVFAKIWQVFVGHIPLYLLDTNLEENSRSDRALTDHLYGGDTEYRIQQEILLGVGGMLALDALGIKPTVYHMNEGHAAFCALERLRRFRKAGLSYEKAVEKTRATGVFTTHTPVPAGHDRFSPKLTLKYLGGLAEDAKLSKDQLLALGREDPTNKKEDFCMTVLALRLSARVNGVSALHGEVTRNMWMKVYGASKPEDVPIGHVTNGIHAQTWLAPEMEPLYNKYLKPKWVGAAPTDDWWKNADRIPPAELWAVRNLLRKKLVHFVRQRLQEQILRRLGSMEELMAAYDTFDENALTLGFSRRFATYKRATLVFHDQKRLAAILNNPKKPVQLVFAGKAHPRDTGGQELCQRIFQFAQSKQFRGRVVLLENYDMHIGRMLTSGCDVWLNNPLRPQEASGTSGMKPPLHGGLNCSILDGWWPEAYNGKNGWAIGDGREFTDRKKQDKHDADAIYELLENEIVPTFYDRDRAGVPQRWTRMMIESMKTVCGQFNSHRMLAEYLEKYYLSAHREQSK